MYISILILWVGSLTFVPHTHNWLNIHISHITVMFLQGGYTPLHRAASCGNPEVVKMLLDNGCDINAEDKVS